jgi:branched-chain amino acid transport system permease protein
VLDNFLQVSLNGLINGSTYALLGVAFGLIIGVTGRFHVAFAVTYTLAAFVAAWLGMYFGVPFWVALIAGALAAALAGAAIDRLVYWPILLRTGTNGLLMVFVASLGVSIVGRNLIALTTLQNSATVVNGFSNVGLSWGPVTISSLNLATAAVDWLLIVALSLLLTQTSLGRIIRAVRTNYEMALCVGIDPAAVTFIVFAIGSFMGGVAGVFQAALTSATPDMGVTPFFYALVVAFVAGLSSPPFVVAAVGLALGLIESWTTLVLPTTWTALVVFAILFVYVALRPVRPAIASA